MVGAPIVPGAQAGPTGELRYEIRWPDGRRLVSRFNRSVDAHKAQLLVEGDICEWKKSPTGISRYLKMKRSPSVKKFAGMLAQGNFTTTQRVICTNTWIAKEGTLRKSDRHVNSRSAANLKR